MTIALPEDSTTAEDVFRPVLRSDERLLWAGQPVLGPTSWDRIDVANILATPLALVLPTIAIHRAIRPQDIWLLATTLVASFLLQVFLLKPLRTRRWATTFYAVTNQRVFIARGTSADKISCLPIDDVHSVGVSPSDKNFPNLLINPGSRTWVREDGSQLQTYVFLERLAYIEDAETVRYLIEKLRRKQLGR